MSKANSKKPQLARSQNWPVWLAAYLESRRNQDFKWGYHDCCIFAADWVRKSTGYDPAKDFRRKYRSEAGALKILKKKNGVRGLADNVFPRVKLAFAKRGDLVAFRDPALKGPAWACTALGILDGRHALFAGPESMRVIPRKLLMKTAWKVGEA